MNYVEPGGQSGGELTACHECDALQHIPALRPGQTVRCRVCGATLLRFPKGGLDQPIALYIAAMILLLLSNNFPFLVLAIQGRHETTTILGASRALYNAGMGELAVVVFITSILAPALLISSSLYVLLAVRFRVQLPAVRDVLSAISYLEPWGMLDVFMLGVLVAFVKLGSMATMHTGIALFAFGGLIAMSAAAAASFEPRLLWHQLGRRTVRQHAG